MGRRSGCLAGRGPVAVFALLAAAALGACGGNYSADGSRPGGAGGTTGDAGGAADAAGKPGTSGAKTDGGPDAACPDADHDGVTTCQGDCDDSDPYTYPGAPEICGDGKTNDCTSAPPDQGCDGLGTFVSSKVGTATGKGTKTDPVDTIARGMQNASTILANNPSMKQIGVYVADGDYPEKVTLVEGVSLYGGFSCESTTSCTWKRDPKTYESRILDQDDEGLLAPQGITRKTALDGFRVQGHGNDVPLSHPEAAAITIAGGSPTISNDIVNGPAISLIHPSSSIGIELTGANGVAIQSPGPLIVSNTIRGGDGGDSSIGISLGPADFSPGTATPPPGTVAEIRRNHIYGGNPAANWGGSYGIVAQTSTDGTSVVNNIIAGGQAQDSSWGIMVHGAFLQAPDGSWGIEKGSGVLLVDSNAINADNSQISTCGQQTTSWCGGVLFSSGKLTLYNSEVYGANAPKSAAVDLQVPWQGQEVVVSSNYLVGAPPVAANAAPYTDAVIVLDSNGCTLCPSDLVVGRIRNNVITPGRASQRFGLLEVPSVEELHPEELQNNDFWVLDPYVTANDVLYERWVGGQKVDLYSLSAVNALPIAAGNFDADCYDATFHLKSGAKCIDAGVSSDAPDHDFEGDKRPQGGGYDVGPDEAK